MNGNQGYNPNMQQAGQNPYTQQQNYPSPPPQQQQTFGQTQPSTAYTTNKNSTTTASTYNAPPRTTQQTTTVTNSGRTQSGPGAPMTNFNDACAKTPKTQNPRDKVIIPWDHNSSNYVYGDTDYEVSKGILTRDQIRTVTGRLILEGKSNLWRS